MKLNHINLCSRDVVALSKIFSSYFDFEIAEDGAVPQGRSGPVPVGNRFSMLRGSDAFSLVITQIEADTPQSYPDLFHVGFTVETMEKVHAKHVELSKGGLFPEPVKMFDAVGVSWAAFYCPVGDGIKIEVNAYTSSERSYLLG